MVTYNDRNEVTQAVFWVCFFFSLFKIDFILGQFYFLCYLLLFNSLGFLLLLLLLHIFFPLEFSCFGASQVAQVVKNLPANAGHRRDAGTIPGSGRSPGLGNGNALQYSCLENPMDRGALQAIVQRVAQSQTQLK